MTDDLVTRLRYLRAGLALEGMGGDASLVGQAADEIERLRAELRSAALRSSEAHGETITAIQENTLLRALTSEAQRLGLYDETNYPHPTWKAEDALRKEAGR